MNIINNIVDTGKKILGIGDDSTTSVINNITQIISSNITSNLQKSYTDITVIQRVSGKCTDNTIKDISKAYVDCILEFDEDNYNNKEILDICSIYNSLCKMGNIDLSQSLDVSRINIQNQSILNNMESDIINSLSQYSGSKTDKYISNITFQVNNNISTIVDKIKQNDSFIQSIDLNNIKGEFISLSSTNQIIGQIIQSDSIISDNINNIANTISQTSVNNEELFKNLLSITGMLLASYLGISIIVKMNNSENVADFFKNIIPILLYIIVSCSIVIIHILTKPSYITFKDTDDVLRFNNQRITLFIFVYIILSIIVTKSIKYFKK